MNLKFKMYIVELENGYYSLIVIIYLLAASQQGDFYHLHSVLRIHHLYLYCLTFGAENISLHFLMFSRSFKEHFYFSVEIIIKGYFLFSGPCFFSKH